MSLRIIETGTCLPTSLPPEFFVRKELWWRQREYRLRCLSGGSGPPNWLFNFLFLLFVALPKKIKSHEQAQKKHQWNSKQKTILIRWSFLKTRWCRFVNCRRFLNEKKNHQKWIAWRHVELLWTRQTNAGAFLTWQIHRKHFMSKFVFSAISSPSLRHGALEPWKKKSPPAKKKRWIEKPNKVFDEWWPLKCFKLPQAAQIT